MRVLLTTLHSKFIHPSLALPYLAAYCHDLDCELLIREFTLHEPKESVLAQLLAEDAEVVCFSTYLWNRHETLDLVDALSIAKPELRIVLGGPEVSFDGEELFNRHPGLSAIVRGEGEEPTRLLLQAWSDKREPLDTPRLALRQGEQIIEGPNRRPLADLDSIPSPFFLNLVDTDRGTVYYETSRGCPYTCAFCMSALDENVRSFPWGRIESDLRWLMEHEVPKVKLVDRTFNYDAPRARNIWQLILKHNRCTHFHFEIGAHLLSEECLTLLETVPDDTFQFEIGVQSTLPETLSAIGRTASLEKLEANVQRLLQQNNIHLHLDLIAGLPGESYPQFLASIDRVLDLHPHHLQVEPVKLLPGSPLRSDADKLGIRFDPNPPYSVLGTPDLDFEQLEKIRTLSRLLDLTWNCNRTPRLYAALRAVGHSPARALESLADHCQQQNALRHPLSQTGVFDLLWNWLQQEFSGEDFKVLRTALARDYAHCERVLPERVPLFIQGELTEEERRLIRQRVDQERAKHRGDGSKLQFFAAPFEGLPGKKGVRVIALFLYLTATDKGRTVEELWVEAGHFEQPENRPCF